MATFAFALYLVLSARLPDPSFQNLALVGVAVYASARIALYALERED